MASKLKKDLRLKIEETLSKSFVTLEGKISHKKFRRNIKKASRALLAGLKVTSSKKKERKIKAEAE